MGHNTIKEFGLRPAQHESAAYVKNKPDGTVDGMVMSHVDDLLLCRAELTQHATDKVQCKKYRPNLERLRTQVSSSVGG